MMFLYTISKMQQQIEAVWDRERENKSLIGSTNMQIPCSIKGNFNYYKAVFSEYLSGVTERVAPDFEKKFDVMLQQMPQNDL